jgi:hypothetical protein
VPPPELELDDELLVEPELELDDELLVEPELELDDELLVEPELVLDDELEELDAPPPDPAVPLLVPEAEQAATAKREPNRTRQEVARSVMRGVLPQRRPRRNRGDHLMTVAQPTKI